MYLTLGTICDKMLLRLNLSAGPPDSLSRKKWTRRSESNRRIRDLQSPALPLGYSADKITSRNSHRNPHPCRNQHWPTHPHQLQRHY